MKLYYAPGACSLATHIVLAEAGLKYDLEAIDLRVSPHQTKTGVILTDIAPKGYVPVLVLDDGEVLTEGAAILQYLADQATDKHLAPANGSMARYRLQEWLNFIATEIHKGFGVLWQPGSSAELKQGALERLSQRFSYIEQQLGQQSFVLGEFSVADAYLFTCLSWTRPLKISLQAWPGLVSYLERVAARPAVQVALREEGLI